MKVAIFHNYMDNIGGAEVVSLVLAQELGADIYTTNADYTKIKKMGFSGDNVHSIGSIPINAPFRQQLALYKFSALKLTGYDFYIIAGDWAVSAVNHHRPNLWCAHSPIREIWDLYTYTRNRNVPPHTRWIFDSWVYLNRFLTRRYVKKINVIVSSSITTQKRVKKYLGRDTEVVYPPLFLSKDKLTKKIKPGGYWLSVNRLIDHKRVDMQMKAFSQLPDEKLIVVGCSEQSKHFKEYRSYIKRIKPSNVKIFSWVSNEKLMELYAGCKGFITTSKDEDFGLTPVEAMAFGKPVIAPYEGGYRETITSKTGILIDDINETKLLAAIKKMNAQLEKKPNRYEKECLKQAKKFSTSIFINKIKDNINQQLKRKNRTR